MPGIDSLLWHLRTTQKRGALCTSLREVFNALRWIVRAGALWRMIPHDLPPWHIVYEQTRRWINNGVFEDIVHDLRQILRLAEGWAVQPTAATFDSRTLQSSRESGQRTGYNGAKRRRGSKAHLAVDTPGHLLALQVTPANEQDRDQVAELAAAVQEVTGKNIKLVFVDAGYTGQEPLQAAAEQGIALEVVTLEQVKKGFVLLPRRWVIERSIG